MPVPPPPGGDYDLLVDDLARRLAAGTRAGATTSPDVFGESAAAGVQATHVLGRMDELVREQARLVSLQEQDERRVQALRERAEAARTPAGRERLREEAGLRGQLGAARERAAEPVGPPRALFRAVEREESQAVGARREAARIAEREEARAERERRRDPPVGPPRELFRQVEREESQAASARRGAARVAEQEEARAERDYQRAARERRAGERRDEAREAREAKEGERAEARRVARRDFMVGGTILEVGRTAERAAAGAARLAGEANPEAAGTLSGSFQGLRIAAGAHPDVQAASRGGSVFMQGLTRAMGEAAQRPGEASAGPGLGRLLSGLGEAFTAPFGGRPPPWFRQNLNLPVAAESFQGGEDYYFGLQRAVSEAGANTLDAQNLRETLQVLREQNGLLGDMKDNTRVLRRGIAAWRQ